MRSVQLQPTGATGTSGGSMCNKDMDPPHQGNREHACFPKDSGGVNKQKKKVRLEERQLLLSLTRVSFTGCSGLLCVCIAPLCVCSCQRLLFSQCINFPFVKYDFQIIKKRKKVLLLQNCKIPQFIISYHNEESQSFTYVCEQPSLVSLLIFT